jgi:hypothetical protein
MNIFYLMAVDFVVWNLSLEGYCKTTRLGKPNNSMRHLGASSGLMLLIKALRQRRPLRSAIFLWLFWLQACLVRAIATLYMLCVVIFQYGTSEDQASLISPNFWVGMIPLINAVVLPLVVVWMFTSFQAPMCDPDGWRWAQIAREASNGDGWYGIRDGKAAWGTDVQSFGPEDGQLLF